ncbi:MULTISPECIES: helix-turn-helix domain-containing protein [unclassified Bacillus (in: firmicutes)]|uniref:helix-turn-helix domain-containing protein n=1 Tax=unclassified Bacillus (in: firmicutes) TaxID=185979 RepID=UPI0008E559E0|nr:MULTISPECIES: helix-turn-helix domain-containing protein [unclassified Bacillus (in: firmicutes)]SFJ66670.1 Helix-turn-helix domain-containing protein [Bacillus sp. 71mf]SFT14351.1 Helix-turn-helix domain-containing protein [Bacillus sp. 103mf]
MHAQKLGAEIKNIRVMRGLTQKQLSDNICHQSEVSRIESGVVYPSMDILQGIAAKLKVPIIHFYEVLAYSDIERKKQFKDQIQSLCKQKKYEEIYKKVWDELKKEEDHPEFQQFLFWHYHLSAYVLKKVNYEYCILELKKLINQQLVGIDVFQNLYIENSIANIYAENRYFQKSIKLYQDILKQLESLHSNEEFAIKVGYNYAKTLYSDEQYEKALKQVEKAIETSCRNSNMTLIGQLFYQKGECLEKLGHSEDDIRIAYEKALFFFELLDLCSYKKTLLKKINV